MFRQIVVKNNGKITSSCAYKMNSTIWDKDAQRIQKGYGANGGEKLTAI